MIDQEGMIDLEEIIMININQKKENQLLFNHELVMILLVHLQKHLNLIHLVMLNQEMNLNFKKKKEEERQRRLREKEKEREKQQSSPKTNSKYGGRQNKNAWKGNKNTGGNRNFDNIRDNMGKTVTKAKEPKKYKPVQVRKEAASIPCKNIYATLQEQE